MGDKNCPLCALLAEPDKAWGRSVVNCAIRNISNYRVFFPFLYTCAWRTHCADLSDTVSALFNCLHRVGYAYERCNTVYGTVSYGIHRLKTRKGNRQREE